MQDTVITNARLVNEGHIVEADLLIRGARIERIDGQIDTSGCTVIDADGRHLMPGMIDDQVHFREPGLTHKGDLESESIAAVAGGITSFMDMPNVKPATTTRAALADKYRLAAGRARANYAFYLGATNDNLAEIRALQPGEACGVKVFMGASTGNLLVDDPQALEAIFRDSPLLIATHCEDPQLIRDNEADYQRRYGADIPMHCHPEIRSAQACLRSSSLAVDLARRHGSRLHVLHLTTAAEMALFEPGPVQGKRITAEVCVHHLHFDERDYAALGARIKCNPAIKGLHDREALIEALLEDRLDVVATDHAPHTADEKEGNYFAAPAGLPLVQHALPCLLEHWHHGHLPLEKLVQKTSHNVAIAYGVRERGFLREGYFADLVLVDLDEPLGVAADNLLYRCGWSPFEGHVFRSSVSATWVCGQLAWYEGEAQPAARGMRLEFEPTPRA